MWLFFTLLIASTHCMHVIDHQNHGALHMEEVIRPESTWIIVVTRGVNDTLEMPSFLVTIKQRLAEDSCMLHLSKHNERKIMLRVHCPLLEMSDGQSPTLTHTEAYLADVFTRTMVIIERNAVHSTPAQWYGTYEHMQVLLKGDAESLGSSYHVLNSEQQEQLYRAESVQYDATPWHLDRVSKRFGLPTHEYLYLNEAADVHVYVMDTGIETEHEEFEGRATFLHSTIRDNINTDCNGHGTHVAGIIGAKTYGVAKKVKLFAVRVLDCKGDGITDGITEGAQIIIDSVHKLGSRPSVINLSLGGARSAVIDDMIRDLKAAGLVVVLAAGNAGKDACHFSPSNLGANNEILSVGASDDSDYRSSYSNYGDCVSIFAPGTGITSTWYTDNKAIKTISGTSMASPMVTGVAALILQQDASLSVDSVNALIIKWATPNIVSQAASRSANLLYSLVDLSHEAIPPIRTSPPLPPPDDVSSAEHNAASSAMICLSLTLLGLLCMS